MNRAFDGRAAIHRTRHPCNKAAWTRVFIGVQWKSQEHLLGPGTADLPLDHGYTMAPEDVNPTWDNEHIFHEHNYIHLIHDF